MPASDRSVADVLQDIIGNIQNIVRSEVRLAKTEVREELAKAQSAGLFVGLGAVSGLYGLLFLLLTIVYALSTVMPTWAAALIVTIVLAITAGAMLRVGLKRLKQGHPTTEKMIESVKENIEWAKQQSK
jgi:uncharacterized membrane protein YqjE